MTSRHRPIPLAGESYRVLDLSPEEQEKPLAVDLCCGLGGWTEGLLEEGWRARGYDIEVHEYGDERYPGELVVADVLGLRGEDVADADLIVASPPCTEYSYMAMPWSRAKQIARALRGEGEFPEGYRGSRTIEQLNAIFDACFRIQREANAIRQARGERPIPMVLENVRGAQPWVGPAAWSYGSYYLWGDVPALMPNVINARKNPGFRFDGSGRSSQTESVAKHVDGLKLPSPLADPSGRRTAPGKGARFTSIEPAEGRKGAGAGAEWFDQNLCKLSSKSPARKAASAKIAKIPLALSSHIARVYRPEWASQAAA